MPERDAVPVQQFLGLLEGFLPQVHGVRWWTGRLEQEGRSRLYTVRVLKVLLSHCGRLRHRVLDLSGFSTCRSGLSVECLRCDLEGRKINFTNSKALVGVATDGNTRYL